MTSLRSRLIGLAVLAFAVGAALPAAADGPRDRGYSPSYWQGLYAGVHAGYGEIGVFPGIDLDGFAGGGLVGYNWQKGQIVYGWEADFSISDISGFDISIDWMATVRGRLGYLFHPDYLAYATAGLGLAHIDFPGNCCPGLDDTGTDFVVGVGVEGKLNQTSTVRLEYLNQGDLDIFRAALTFKLSGY